MTVLRANGIFCFKIHGGPTMMSGLPDIIACVPVRPLVEFQGIQVATDEPVGLFIGLETKTPTGGDPSPIQARVHDNIRAAFGQVYVVRSVQDALDALQYVGWRPIPPGHPVPSVGN